MTQGCPAKENKKASTKTKSLAQEFAEVINRRSREDDSDTPDFILGEYLVSCLEAFELASNKREVYYGQRDDPGK